MSQKGPRAGREKATNRDLSVKYVHVFRMLTAYPVPRYDVRVIEFDGRERDEPTMPPSPYSSSSIVPTVWSTFPTDTEYFGPNSAPFMLNYRVRDLDAMLAQLRAAGASVEERTQEYDYGRFGWATDPSGRRDEGEPRRGGAGGEWSHWLASAFWGFRQTDGQANNSANRRRYEGIRLGMGSAPGTSNPVVTELQDLRAAPPAARQVIATCDFGETSNKWAHQDSNLGPQPYQGCALTN